MKLAYILTLVAGVVAAEPMVFLIRHGEKPADDDEPGLSTQGKQRAQCLREVFGAGSNYHVGHIMAQAYKPGTHTTAAHPSRRTQGSVGHANGECAHLDGSRKRPFDTVSPLAQDLGLEVDTSCDRNDSKCVKKVVKNYKGSGNILICWEHKALKDIAEELGAENVKDYPKKRFDEIWIDPYPYSEITDIVSENCPGLDN
ncbi:phosphoglycerate mutase family protein, putative [Metarhizium acridum CQMa 102]|uniref:Phosphoglycerate mutase family protein, putative n=1 Tax=Metarhizium acridum (strain CQMa 102) TaxID=655827 RepID=E9E3M2_METAQ|nr:phosphoglycerate mutase family protein, putative [Metarhizium acridum CQMa 102]EFY89447.1 phosphoglycerate mutase family protein, putative [Metarhizium acridum CQMa 102]